MGILNHTSDIKGNTLKIPDYAKDYKNEYLFIRGIDKYFKYFIKNKRKANKGVFKNNRVDIIKKHINRLERASKMGYLKDTSNLEVDKEDVICSFFLLESLGSFSVYYVHDEWKFDIFLDCVFQVIKILLNVLSYFIVNLK